MQDNAGAIPSPLMVKNALTSSAYDLGYPGDIQGAGHINASAAAELITGVGVNFLIESNGTYDNIFWTNTRALTNFGNFYYIAPGVEAYVNDLLVYDDDPFVAYPDWNFDADIMDNYYHADNSLATGNVYEGDTYSSLVGVFGNSSDITASAEYYTMTDATVTYSVVNASQEGLLLPVTEIFCCDNNTAEGIADGTTHRLFLNLSDSFDFSGADFVELHFAPVASGVRYIDLFDHVDADTNGMIEWGQGSSSDIAPLGGHSAYGGTGGYFKLGNVNNYNNLFIAVRSSSSTSASNTTAFDGNDYVVTARKYTRTAWPQVFVTPSTTQDYFNVSIDTTGWATGMHTGWLTFNDGTTTQRTPVTVKVNYGVIGSNATATAGMNTLGTVELSNSPNGGNGAQTLEWLNFAVDETAHNVYSESGINQDWFAVKVSVDDYASLPAWPETDLTAYIKRDDIGQFRSGQVVHEVEGFTDAVNGVIYYFFNWDDTLYTRCNPGGAWEGLCAPKGIFNYQVGVTGAFGGGYASDYANVSVTVEAYFITGFPDINITFVSDNGVSTGEVLTGPNANLTILADIVGDANLDWTIGFGELIDRDIIEGERSFPAPLSTSDRGMDDAFSVVLIAGDLINYKVYTLDTGCADDDPCLGDDIDIHVFYPSNTHTPPAIGTDGAGDADFSTYTNTDGNEAIAEGVFVAPETGTYWVGVDSFGTTKDYAYIFSPSASGSVDTGQKSSYTINTDGLYDDGDYNLEGKAITGSNLDSFNEASNKASFTFDNQVAPSAEFTATTLAIFPVLDRKLGSIDLSWTGTDLNGDDIKYEVRVVRGEGLSLNEQLFVMLATGTSATSFKWDFSNHLIYPDGTYSFRVTPRDSTAQGGVGTAIEFAVIINTDITPDTITVDKTVVVPTTVTKSTPGFTLFFLLLGSIVFVLILSKKRKK